MDELKAITSNYNYKY